MPGAAFQKDGFAGVRRHGQAGADLRGDHQGGGTPHRDRAAVAPGRRAAFAAAAQSDVHGGVDLKVAAAVQVGRVGVTTKPTVMRTSSCRVTVSCAGGGARRRERRQGRARSLTEEEALQILHDTIDSELGFG